jgi:hypothetical protein
VAVAISVPADIGCVNSQYWLGYAPCGTVECTEYPTWLGSKRRYWFVDLGGGQRARMVAETEDPSATTDLDAELQQIVDSIRFE